MSATGELTIKEPAEQRKSADSPLLFEGGRILPDEAFDRIKKDIAFQTVDREQEIHDISSTDSEEIRSDVGTQEEQAESKEVEHVDNLTEKEQALTEDEAREDAERSQDQGSCRYDGQGS